MSHAMLTSENIVLVLLRAWAIWGCKYHIAVTMITAYVVYLAASVGVLIYFIVIDTNLLKGV